MCIRDRCKEYEVNKGKLYGLRVYVKALKRYVSLAVRYPMDGRTDKWQLYFSTDDSMDGREVLDYYRTRFQLEFCFRDGKQHAGITNCQSTDFRKLDFHFNASLAAVNFTEASCTVSYTHLFFWKKEVKVPRNSLNTLPAEAC